MADKRKPPDDGIRVILPTDPNCPRCGAPMAASDIVCTQCGYNRHTRVTLGSSSSAKLPGTGISRAMIAVIVLVALGVTAGAFGVYKFLGRAAAVPAAPAEPGLATGTSATSTGESGAASTSQPPAAKRKAPAGREPSLWDYPQGLHRSIEMARELRVDVGVKQAVAAYQALEGRYPKSVEELKAADMEVPTPPDGYQYQFNAQTGEVTLVPTPPAPRPR